MRTRQQLVFVILGHALGLAMCGRPLMAQDGSPANRTPKADAPKAEPAKPVVKPKKPELVGAK